MKIYEIQYNCGEKEWIAANTIIEALKISSGFSDMDLVDFEYEDEIIIVPKEKWKDMYVTDPDCYDENNEQRKLYSFQEWMDKNNKPDMIAMTAH